MSETQISVPEDETPAGECAYCGRPFPTSDRLALHKGVVHPRRLDDAERDAFEAARSEEQDRLRRFRLAALGVLVLLYFGFLMSYAIVT